MVSEAAPAPIQCTEQSPVPTARRRSTVLILLAILIVAAALRFVNLARAVPGLHQDEAANAWNAYCLLKTGRDQVGVRWPVFYSRCLGSNRSTVYLYALLPFQAIGGMNVWTTRLPSAVGGVIAVLLLYYVGSRLFGRTTGLAAAGLMALNPWHLQMARWGHEAGLCPLLVLAPLAALVWAGLPFGDWADRRPRARLAALAGGLAGLCCYGYPAVRLFLPVFLAAAVVVTWRACRRRFAGPDGRRAVVGFLGAAAVTFGPLVLVHVVFPGEIARRAQQVWVWDESDAIGVKVGKVLARYPGHFGLDFLFISGDPSAVQSPPDAGQFHWYALPMMIAGTVVVVSRLRSSRAARVLLVWVLLYPVGDLLFESSGMHALRSLPGAGGMVLLSAVGVVAAGRWLGRRHRRAAWAAGFVLAIAAIGTNARFLRTFYGTYPRYYGIYRRFHVDLFEAFEWVRPRLDEFDAVFCTGQGIVQPYVLTLVGLRYDPRQWFLDEPPALTNWDWDVYPGYGKMHFLFGDLGHAPLHDLTDNGRDDRVLLIIRPGELGFEKPTHEITGPFDKPMLWLVDVTL